MFKKKERPQKQFIINKPKRRLFGSITVKQNTRFKNLQNIIDTVNLNAYYDIIILPGNDGILIGMDSSQFKQKNHSDNLLNLEYY